MTSVLKAAATIALLSMAGFFLFLALSVRHLVLQLDATLLSVSRTAASTQRTIEQLQPAIAEMKPTLADMRRTIEIAGGTVNLARDTLRDEQSSIRAANQQTISTMTSLGQLVAGASESQKSIALKVNATLDSVPPVMQQTEKDLAALDVTIEQSKPLLDQTTATMANAARISADLARITDDATKPQPWYRRVWGYVWAPVKLAAVFTK